MMCCVRRKKEKRPKARKREMQVTHSGSLVDDVVAPIDSRGRKEAPGKENLIGTGRAEEP
jgi:hypothetical protein